MKVYLIKFLNKYYNIKFIYFGTPLEDYDKGFTSFNKKQIKVIKDSGNFIKTNFGLSFAFWEGSYSIKELDYKYANILYNI